MFSLHVGSRYEALMPFDGDGWGNAKCSKSPTDPTARYPLKKQIFVRTQRRFVFHPATSVSSVRVEKMSEELPDVPELVRL